MTAIHIGPYRYTETDARRTLLNLDPWWEQLAIGRDATSLWPLAAHLDETMASILRIASTGVSDFDRLGKAASKAPVELLPELLTLMLESLAEAGAALRAAGQMPATQYGTVEQLSSSKGGLPKLPVDAIEVNHAGLIGDRQATRFHHGRPWQALCMWSAEVIEAFAADGHPIGFGSTGENITLRGIDWSELGSGVQLRIGEVLCEASLWALPCFQNRRWFIEGDFNLMHHDRGPVSRMYATVLEPGRIATGDVASLEPARRSD